MTLLKFVEFQQKDTILNKIPIPIKLVPFLYTLVSIFLPVNKEFVIISLILIIMVDTLLIAIFYKDLVYLAELCFAYFVLFAISYVFYFLSSMNIVILLEKMLYVYAVSFSFIFIFITTKVKDLENFLLKLRVPQKVVNFFVLTWNLIPSTYRELQLIYMSQKARGIQLGRGIISRLKNSMLILIPFMYILLIRYQVLEISLKARGVS